MNKPRTQNKPGTNRERGTNREQMGNAAFVTNMSRACGCGECATLGLGHGPVGTVTGKPGHDRPCLAAQPAMPGVVSVPDGDSRLGEVRRDGLKIRRLGSVQRVRRD